MFRAGSRFTCALAGLLGLLLVSLSLHATDSAVGQFSNTDNPNGNWSYGTATLSGREFTLLPSGYCNALLGWMAGESFPWILGNPTSTTQFCGDDQVPPTILDMLPGDGDTYSVVRWTAPSAGSFLIQGLFVGNNRNGTSADVHVLLNGIPIFSHLVNRPGASIRFKLTETLQAGGTIDFAVGNGTHKRDGTNVYDSIGFSAEISNQETQ